MNVNNTDIFKAYFDAFEETYEDDHWGRLADFFSEDMVYNNVEGDTLTNRQTAINYLRESVNALDRRFDARAFDGKPFIGGEGDLVTLEFTIRYQIDGAPDLVITGLQVATFRNAKIQQMDDVFDAASLEQFENWMARHSELLA